MNSIAQRAQGRWVSILTGFGIDEKYLDGKHHDCPICQAGKDRFRFTDYEGKGKYICNQCDSGDGFDLLAKIFNWDFKKTAEEIEKILPTSTLVKPKPKKEPLGLLRKIARNCVDGLDVAGYLNGRGLKHDSSLRQCQLDYFDDGKKLGTFQCMVALIVDEDNEPVSFHITYLQNRTKANVPSPKKIMPGIKTISGCAVRFGTGSHICVTEGIETALSVRELTGLPVWAALNAGNMEKLIIPSEVQRVDIYADNDFNFAGQKSAFVLANKLALAGICCDVIIPEVSGTDFADYVDIKL